MDKNLINTTNMEEDQKWGVAGRSVGRTCSEHPCKKRFWRNWKDLSGITVGIVFSVLSLGFCVLVYLRTSELQSRILNLEQQRDTQLSAWISLEQVEPVIFSRIDQILEEVRVMDRLFHMKHILTFCSSDTLQVGLLCF